MSRHGSRREFPKGKAARVDSDIEGSEQSIRMGAASCAKLSPEKFMVFQTGQRRLKRGASYGRYGARTLRFRRRADPRRIPAAWRNPPGQRYADQIGCASWRARLMGAGTRA